MNSFLLLLVFNSVAAWASTHSTADFRFPQDSLPAINVHLTRFTPENRAQGMNGKLDIQVLCENGEIHLTKKIKANVARICHYAQTVWNPKTDRIRVDYGVPDGVKQSGACAPDHFAFKASELIEKYCGAQREGGAP